jgi:sulfide dehydrogenase [flavocytochrome c] flavoprotein chain
MSFNRRDFIKTVGASSVIVPLSACAAPSGGRSAGGKARIVVIGGGFGGATAAKYFKVVDPSLDVTLVERQQTYTSCPLSNEVFPVTASSKICNPAMTV